MMRYDYDEGRPTSDEVAAAVEASRIPDDPADQPSDEGIEIPVEVVESIEHPSDEGLAQMTTNRYLIGYQVINKIGLAVAVIKYDELERKRRDGYRYEPITMEVRTRK